VPVEDETMPAKRILLEVCITSPDDAATARRARADRLELNAALELGGLTPSPGCLAAVRMIAPIPVIVMIRPRLGGFCYSAADFDVMAVDTQLALQYGADGIAFGILDETGRIDRRRCRILRERAGGRQTVFHRAFDLTPDPFAALEELIDLGFTRVLTSGQRESAVSGKELLCRLIEKARGRIEILPAGGINRATARGRDCDRLRPGPRLAARPGD
jgi:copper homeostasis protein